MESWGFLLLCSHLGNPERRPLTTAQLRVLSQRVQNHGPWEDPGDLTPKSLKALGYPEEFSERIVALLEEEELLSRYLQKAKNRKCVPITRQDPRYPQVLREKLGPDAPGTLWAKGDLRLLEEPMVALVGSRELEMPNSRFAMEAGLQAARQGYVLVSGNAVGADRTAQRACWKAAKDMAGELIQLYAARKRQSGYAFSADAPWQREFEDNFPYPETDDQLRCIADIKKDM